MGNGDLKIQLIKEITEFHPGYETGKKYGWSYYVGGMGDHGDWYIRKMLDASIEDLQKCLEEIKEEAKPFEKVYTEQELKDLNTPTIITLQNGNKVYSNALQDKLWNEIVQKKETHLIWGSQQNTKQA